MLALTVLLKCPLSPSFFQGWRQEDSHVSVFTSPQSRLVRVHWALIFNVLQKHTQQCLAQSYQDANPGGLCVLPGFPKDSGTPGETGVYLVGWKTPLDYRPCWTGLKSTALTCSSCEDLSLYTFSLLSVLASAVSPECIQHWPSRPLLTF